METDGEPAVSKTGRAVRPRRTQGVAQRPPEGKSWISRLLWFLPALGVFLFLLPLMSPVIVFPNWDEYIVTFDAQRLLSGQVPYRDFFNFIPPGIFYFLAAAAAPFGRATLTISRYASLLLILVNWLLLRAALERAGWSRRQALLLSLVYPVCLYPFWPAASHHWLVQLACMGFLVVAGGEAGSRTRFAALLGFCAGAAGVVLQTEALYLAAGGAVLLLLSCRGRALWRSLGAWAAGMALPLLAGFGPLLLKGAGRSMVRDLLVWPARNYSRPGNDNALPLLEDLPARMGGMWSAIVRERGLWASLPMALANNLLYGGILLLIGGLAAAALWVVVRAVKRRSLGHPLNAVAAVVTVLGFGFYLRGRTDWLHLVYLFALLMPFWLVAAAKAGQAESRRRKMVLAAAVLLVTGGVFQSRWVWYHWPRRWELADVDRPVRESAVNRWLHSPGVLGPGETVAAFAEGGEVYLYGVPPAVGYTFFLPLSYGYNSLRDHEIAAAQMEKSRPRWVLVPPGMEKAYLDPASAVGRLLTEKYERRGRAGGAVVYERRPVSKFPTP